MKQYEFRMTSACFLAGLLLLSARILSAQDPEWVYNQNLEKARTDRLQKKYKDSATAATRAFYLADHLKQSSTARQKAAELSISSNAAARNSGTEFRGPWSVVIQKEDHKLYLLEKGTICRVYDFVPGADFSTPAGSFTVGEKLGYPHYELNGTLYRMGDPGNPLGSRWIELCGVDGTPVSGIHGESGNSKKNLLFFNLKNTDINEIFGLLAKGSKIEVK